MKGRKMGLTINYTIAAKTAEQAIDGLEKLRQKCLDLPFEDVGVVLHKQITQEDIDYFDSLQAAYSYPNNSQVNLQHRDRLMEERGLTTWELIKSEGVPSEVISLELWPGEGCESCDITFYKKDGVFRASEFCKTQYAAHFVRCHTLVVAMLDIMAELGFDLKVDDEGGFYESRDMKILAKNLDDYNIIVKSIGGMIKAAGWPEDQIVCALDKNKTIIKITD